MPPGNGRQRPNSAPPLKPAPKAKKPNTGRQGYDYTGSKNGGLWKNSNGTVVGRSDTEDSEITPYKSTGDVGAVAKYIKQRKAAGTKGY